MAFTVGFLSFFLFTFLAIVGIMIYNGMGHHVDYAESYKYISFPAGCVVLVASLIFFGTPVAAPKVSWRLGGMALITIALDHAPGRREQSRLSARAWCREPGSRRYSLLSANPHFVSAR